MTRPVAHLDLRRRWADRRDAEAREHVDELIRLCGEQYTADRHTLGARLYDIGYDDGEFSVYRAVRDALKANKPRPWQFAAKRLHAAVVHAITQPAYLRETQS